MNLLEMSCVITQPQKNPHQISEGQIQTSKFLIGNSRSLHADAEKKCLGSLQSFLSLVMNRIFIKLFKVIHTQYSTLPRENHQGNLLHCSQLLLASGFMAKKVYFRQIKCTLQLTFAVIFQVPGQHTMAMAQCDQTYFSARS